MGRKGFALIEKLAKFRNVMRRVFKLLKVDGHKFQLYGLRRGGATLRFQQGSSYDKACGRDRWQSVKNMRLYVNQGLRDLSSQKLSGAAKARIKAAKNTVAWNKF